MLLFWQGQFLMASVCVAAQSLMASVGLREKGATTATRTNLPQSLEIL